jgi:hypothetical protein
LPENVPGTSAAAVAAVAASAGTSRSFALRSGFRYAADRCRRSCKLITIAVSAARAGKREGSGMKAV